MKAESGDDARVARGIAAFVERVLDDIGYDDGFDEARWKASQTPVSLQLRAEAEALDAAMETLGHTAGIFGSTREYARLRGNVSAYTAALLYAATVVEHDNRDHMTESATAPPATPEPSDV